MLSAIALVSLSISAHAALPAFKVAEGFEFVVEYPEWEDCSMAPTDGSEQFAELTGSPAQRVPCGEGIQFYVVLVPCPADLIDPACWDPISSPGGEDVPLCRASGGPGAPFGGCLPAMRTENGFRTGPVSSLPHGPGLDTYALASVYWTNTNSPGYAWVPQVDVAQRIPLGITGTFELSPCFLPLLSGRSSEIQNVNMEQFGQGTVQNIGVYEPPSCVENPATCSKAKVVIILDGPVPGLVNFPYIAQRADSTIAQRRSNSVIMIFVPSSMRRANETSNWPCSRQAMLTPVPCPELGECYTGQNDDLFKYIGDTLLPLVRERFHGAGRGQKAGIMGYSLGGLTSCNAVWVRPDLFDAAGCNSPSIWYPQPRSPDLDGTYFLSAMAKYPVPTAKLYVSYGTSEGQDMGGSRNASGPAVLIVQKMRAAGMDLVFEERGGYPHIAAVGMMWSEGFWTSLEAVVPYESRPAVRLM